MDACRCVKVRAPLRNTCELADDVDEGAAGLSAVNGTEGAKSDQSTTAGSESTAALKSSDGRPLRQPVHLTKAARQESPPPAFEFKRGKTRFRKRKLVQHEQQQQRSAADEKRIREMIAYFARLDKQVIEVE